jgi:hypothetical protein
MRKQILLSVSILLGCIILGGFFYASQVSKQRSIERQQILKQMEDRKIEDAKIKQESAENEAQRKKEIFDLKFKCKNLFNDLDKRFNNVAGVYYDELLNTCIVKYFENGETMETTIEDFQVKK